VVLNKPCRVPRIVKFFEIAHQEERVCERENERLTCAYGLVLLLQFRKQEQERKIDRDIDRQID